MYKFFIPQYLIITFLMLLYAKKKVVLQVVIFVKSVQRCVALAQLLTEQNFPAIGIHRGMNQEERLSRYQQFKDFKKVFQQKFKLLNHFDN